MLLTSESKNGFFKQLKCCRDMFLFLNQYLMRDRTVKSLLVYQPSWGWELLLGTWEPAVIDGHPDFDSVPVQCHQHLWHVSGHWTKSFIPKPDCSTTVFLLRWPVHSEDFNIVLTLACTFWEHYCHCDVHSSIQMLSLLCDSKCLWSNHCCCVW